MFRIALLSFFFYWIGLPVQVHAPSPSAIFVSYRGLFCQLKTSLLRVLNVVDQSAEYWSHINF